MFDTNNFKRSVKEWVKTNPKGTLMELTDYCEELIPAPQFQANSWLIDQTLGWYEHILNSRRNDHMVSGEADHFGHED